MAFKPISREQLEVQGYIIDDHAPGRPYAYKGPRFGQTGEHEGFAILTDLEVKLQTALRTLIEAAKAMPENPHTPSQNALDDAVEAAEKVVGEVA